MLLAHGQDIADSFREINSVCLPCQIGVGSVQGMIFLELFLR